MTSEHLHPADNGPIPAPWVLIDDLTLDQTACLLERLVSWLTSPETRPAAHSMSSGL